MSLSFAWPMRVATLSVLLAAWPHPVVGQEALFDYDLAGGPLSKVVVEISLRGAVVVSFDPALLARHTAPPIHGRLSVIQALNLVTQGTGLRVKWVDGGVLTVQADVAPELAQSVETSPAPDLGASDAAPTIVALPPVVVFGSGWRAADGLRVSRGWTASRTDTPLADLPQAVSVLTNDALHLQAGQTSTEALQYVPGATLSISGSPSGLDGLTVPGVQLRGLRATYALSGMRTQRSIFPADTSFIERIEVIKGPSSVIGGMADVGGRGGVINLVRKQAEPGQRPSMSLTANSQDSGSVYLNADQGGAWNDQTFWRVLGYGSTTGRTEGGYIGQNSSGLMGTMSWLAPAFKAALTLQADRRRLTPAAASRGGQLRPGGDVTPVEGGELPPEDPNDHLLSKTSDVDVDLEWRFSSQWRATWKGRVESVQADILRHQPNSAINPARRVDTWNAAVQGGLLGNVVTGALQHKLLLGLDLERWRMLDDGVLLTNPLTLVTIDSGETRLAVLLQDQLSWGPWRARLSVQRSRLLDRDYEEIGRRIRQLDRPTATNWEAGLLLHVSDAWSVYAGSQSTLEADERDAGFTLANTATAAPYTRLRQMQAGLKWHGWEDRLNLTLEAYRLRERDVVYPSSLVLPGRASDGLELEMTGRPYPGVDLRVGWAWARGQQFLPETAAAVSGVTLPLGGVSRQSVQLLARYQLPEQWLPDSRVSVGWRAESSKFSVLDAAGDRPVSILALPGGGQLDVSLDRSFGPWGIRASVRNALDQRLYGTQSDFRYIPLLPGRSVGVTATYRPD